MINNMYYDILIFTETWLNVNITNAMLNPTNHYNLFRLDRGKHARGGGILIYINSKFNSFCLSEYLTTDFELLCINFLNYRLIVVYRPPNMIFSDTTILCELLGKIVDSVNTSLIFGDFNLPGINWITGTSITQSELFVYNFIQSKGLLQLINFNTRCNNIIDLIFTNNELIVSNINSLSPFEYDNHISDHSAIDVYLLIDNLYDDNCPTKKYYNYNKSDLIKIKDHLLTIDWDVIFSPFSDPDELMNIFTETTNHIINLYTPLKRSHVFKYPIEIKKLLNKCRKLHKKADDKVSRDRWRSYKSLLSNKIKTHNINFEHRVLSSSSKSAFYGYINHQLKSKDKIPPLINPSDPTCIYTNDLDKANCLSKQFSSVFVPDNNEPISIDISNSSFNSFPITQEIVRKFLCLLPNKFNNSPDGLPKGMLKLLSFELSYPICKVFNYIFDKGICPTVWKAANIIPIFKKGDSSSPSNYRPISKLPSTLILFEKILSYYLLYYLRSNNLLCTEQYGFLAGKSTELQLLEFYSNLIKSSNRSFKTDIIYIDMAKAFDTVCHSKLLSKISKLNIGGKVLIWFKSYLTNRIQRIRINDTYSEYCPASSGVPQGSVIGPLLFLIYINDLPSIFPPSLICSLFADDAKISISFNNIHDRLILQNSLSLLNEWTEKWDLKVAIAKCASMTIGNTNNHLYNISDSSIPHCTSFRDLGIVFENNMKFNIHINNICNKAYIISNILFRCFITSNPYYITKAYTTYVRPLLEYGSSIWNPGSIFIGLKNSIEKVQKKFTKRIFYRCSIPIDNYSMRLTMLKLIPLSHRRLQADLIMVFKIINKLVDIDASLILDLYVNNNRGPKSKDKKRKMQIKISNQLVQQ